MKNAMLGGVRRTLAIAVGVIASVAPAPLRAEECIAGFWQFNEGAGTNALDISGFARHGSLCNMDSAASWVDGISRTALHFNGPGSSNYVDCGNAAALNFNENNAFTIACWIRPESFTNYQGIVGKWAGGWAGSPYQLTLYIDKRLRICIGGGGTNYADVLIPASNFTAGAWHHVAATYDGATLRGYVNGLEQGATNTGGLVLTSNVASLKIGRYSSDAATFNGDIDEVLLCNYALPEEDIYDLFDRLIGWWPLDEGSGLVAADISVFTNQAALIGMDENNWVDGQLAPDGYFRHALHFNGAGSSNYVDCGNDGIYNFNDNNAFTIAGWVRPLNPTYYPAQGIIGKWAGGWAGSPYQLAFLSSGLLRICIGGGGTNYANIYLPAAEFPTGAWRHVAATYDGSVLRGYVNGVEKCSTNAGGLVLASNSASLKIGRYASDTYTFNGDIDDVRLHDRALSSNEIFQSVQMLSARPDRNYYTGEDAVALCSLQIEAADGLAGNCYLIARDAQGNALGTNAAPGVETDLAFSTSAFTAGVYAVKIELRKNSGELLHACQMEIVVQNPRPGGGEVKMDLRKGIVLRDGVGFFPLGIYTHTLGYGVSTRGAQDGEEGMFEFLSDVGFNTLVRQKSYTNATMFLNLADQYGLAVINWTSPQPPLLDTNLYPTLEDRLAVHWAWYTNMEPDIISEITTLSGHSNLLAYYNVDEPNLMNAEERIAVAEWYWNTVTNIDIYRPQMLLYARSIPAGDDWTRWGQVLGYDVYPCPFMGGLYNDPGRGTAYYAWQLRERCRADRKVMWFVPVANMLDPARSPIGMDRARMLCQAYAAVIYGARGLLYFALPNAIGEDAWYALETINYRMSQMAPALLNGDIPQNIGYTPDNFNPAAQQFPMVNAAVFKYPDGNYLLLAVNILSNAVDTTFTVDGILSCTRLFDNPGALSLNGESFAEQIEAYGVRAYTLTLAAGSEPVQAGVSMTERADLPASAVDIDGIIAQMHQGKNYCPNPCFDRQFNTGIPDFYRPYFCLSVDPLAGQVGSTWYVDDATTWSNNPSLCMYRCPLISSEPETRGTFGSVYPAASGEMTFSFYALGGQAGDRIWVRLNVSGDWTAPVYQAATFTLATNAWQRCQMTFNMETNAANKGARELLMCPASFDDTVWVSGLQLELGDSATAFQDDSD